MKRIAIIIILSSCMVGILGQNGKLINCNSLQMSTWQTKVNSIPFWSIIHVYFFLCCTDQQCQTNIMTSGNCLKDCASKYLNNPNNLEKIEKCVCAGCKAGFSKMVTACEGMIDSVSHQLAQQFHQAKKQFDQDCYFGKLLWFSIV